MRDMNAKNGLQANQVSFSIYIFMALLLGSFGVAGIYDFLQSSQPGWAVANGFLMTIHIGLHWLNLRNFAQRRWWLLSYGLQTALIITLGLSPPALNSNPRGAPTARRPNQKWILHVKV